MRGDAGLEPPLLCKHITERRFDVTNWETPMSLEPAPPPRKRGIWKSPVALWVAGTLFVALCIVFGLVAFALRKIGGAL
jgi:hypothetical protein